jgi:hypothetical protein
MVSVNTLISKLEPFLGKKDVIIYNQDTTDIIDGILNNHQKYQSEYDKIYRYFIEDDNTDQTAYNVWCFLKDNFSYVIEPEKMQVLRSPAAILGSNRNGIDCKGYATFAAGVMSAWKRNAGKKYDVVYRFASYDAFDKTPQHVFVVIKEDGNEYWIDPVLDEYDQKKQPYFYKDKKIDDMALIALSGLDRSSSTNYNNNIGGVVIDTYGDPVVLDAPAITTGGGFDWTNIFTNLLQAVPNVIRATQPTPNFGNNLQPTTVQPRTASTGLNTNTLLLIAAAGIGVYFFTKKRR